MKLVQLGTGVHAQVVASDKVVPRVGRGGRKVGGAIVRGRAGAAAVGQARDRGEAMAVHVLDERVRGEQVRGDAQQRHVQRESERFEPHASV